MDIITGWKWHDVQVFGEDKEGKKTSLFPGMDDVRVELNRPTVEVMLLLMPFIGREFTTITAALEEGYKAQALVEKIFPACVRGIDGVTIDGKSPTVSQIATEPALVGFVWCVFNKLIQIGTMQDDEAKNLKRQSDSSGPETHAAPPAV